MLLPGECSNMSVFMEVGVPFSFCLRRQSAFLYCAGNDVFVGYELAPIRELAKQVDRDLGVCQFSSRRGSVHRCLYPLA